MFAARERASEGRDESRERRSAVADPGVERAIHEQLAAAVSDGEPGRGSDSFDAPRAARRPASGSS
jgi:hypothetical protein